MLNELSALGNYPTLVRKVAVTNGSLNGTETPMTGDKYFDFYFRIHLPDPLAGGGDDLNNSFSVKVTPATGQPFFNGQEDGPIKKCDLLSCWYSTKGGGYVAGYSLASTTSVNPIDGAPGSLSPLPSFAYKTAADSTADTCEQFHKKGIQCSSTINFYNNYYHSFIPTVSALGIDLSHINSNLLAMADNSLETLASQYTPFNKIYAIGNGLLNTEHVAIDSHIANGLYDEITLAYSKSVFEKISPIISLLLDGDESTTCTYALTTGTNLIPASAGTYQAAIKTGANCEWDLSSDKSWLIFSSTPSGKGDGIIGFSVDANSTYSKRTDTITLTSPTDVTVSKILLIDQTAKEGISVADASVKEGAVGQTKNIAFTIQLSKASTKTVTVNYNTQNGTAIAPSDYITRSGKLAFLPGETVKKLAVKVIGNNILESNETFSLVLSSPTAPYALQVSKATGTILNDDIFD